MQKVKSCLKEHQGKILPNKHEIIGFCEVMSDWETKVCENYKTVIKNTLFSPIQTEFPWELEEKFRQHL